MLGGLFQTQVSLEGRDCAHYVQGRKNVKKIHPSSVCLPTCYSPGFAIVIISYCVITKYPAWVIYNSRNEFLTVLEGEQPKIKTAAGAVSGEGLFLLPSASVCAHTAAAQKGSFRLLLISFVRTFISISISWTPHLLILIMFQHMNWGEYLWIITSLGSWVREEEVSVLWTSRSSW